MDILISMYNMKLQYLSPCFSFEISVLVKNFFPGHRNWDMCIVLRTVIIWWCCNTVLHSVCSNTLNFCCKILFISFGIHTLTVVTWTQTEASDMDTNRRQDMDTDRRQDMDTDRRQDIDTDRRQDIDTDRRPDMDADRRQDMDTDRS